MKVNKQLRWTLIAATLASFISLQAEPVPSPGHSAGDVAKPDTTIVSVAAKSDNFKTLVAAVTAAGLVDTLQSKGPFTVFAPTDSAFAKLKPGTVEHLLKPENREALTSILTYHVVAGKILAADVKTGEVKTVQGQKVSLKVCEDGVTINGAKVIKTDILTGNGVIHVIDSVIIPQS